MSYVVMARKYRPMSFAELTGQGHVVRTLQNAVRKNRLSHAYLFAGPRGVGKTTTARVLAKAMNCESGSGPVAEPCNACRSCREVNEGRSLDVIEIDGASNRRIEEVRELRETVKFAPSASRFKVYIIDEVHMLTPEAFNALLKTLEEPPPHIKFILATTSPDKLPTTIQSRCQRFDFRLLTREEIVAHLEAVCDWEKLSLDRGILHQVARAAEGSLRDALSLLEQVVSFAGEKPGVEELEEVLHVVRGEVLDRFIRGIAERDAADLMRIIDELAARGFDMRRFLNEVLEWIRGMMLVSVSTDLAGLIPLAEEDRRLLEKRAGQFSRGRLQALVETAIEAERELRQATNPRYVMEAVALKMALTSDFDTMERLTARLEDLYGRLGGRATTPPPARGEPSGAGDRISPPPPAAPGPSIDPGPPRGGETATSPEGYLELTGEESGGGDGDAPRGEWELFVAEVMKRKKVLGHYLEHGRMIERDAAGMVIGFSTAFFLENAREKEHAAIINEAAERLFGNGKGFRVRLELVKDESGEASREKQHRVTDLAKKKREEALRNPLVQEIIDIFGGQVVDVKILHTLRNDGGMQA